MLTIRYCCGAGCVLKRKGSYQRWQQTVCQWDKAFDVQLSGVSSLNTGMVPLPVTVFRYGSKAGIFSVTPGFQTYALPSPALRDNGKKTLVSNLYLSCVSTPLVITPPAILPRSVHSPQQSLIPLAHPLVGTPPVIWPGFVYTP